MLANRDRYRQCVDWQFSFGGGWLLFVCSTHAVVSLTCSVVKASRIVNGCLLAAVASSVGTCSSWMHTGGFTLWVCVRVRVHRYTLHMNLLW